MERLLNQIIYGFHLMLNRFDFFLPNTPCSLARHMFGYVVGIYVFSIINLVLLMLGRDVRRYFYYNNTCTFIMYGIVFLSMVFLDYYLFRKGKGDKYFQEFCITYRKSGSTCIIAALLYVLGAVWCLTIVIRGAILWPIGR